MVEAASGETCWTIIRGAAAGDGADRERFARRYEPIVRAFLASRWAGSKLRQDVDDATQDVFAECLRCGGPLDRADPGRPGGFRVFLHAVARNVARRSEARRARDRAGATFAADDLADEGETPSLAFDRAWAKSLLREAADLLREEATGRDEAFQKRVDLLRLRFHDGLPIREIARLWGVDAAGLHHQYARARDEFLDALRRVVRFHNPSASPAEVDRECAELPGMLG